MPKLFLVICVLLAVLSSCDSNTEVSEMRSLSGNWDKNDVIHFEIPQLDSLKRYNIYVHLRNTNDYPFNNLFLIASINFPFGKTVTDTLEYRMAHPDGRWMGTGIGSIKENKLWYKENVSFFEDGLYSIDLSHAVRNNGDVNGVSQLQGITDVGISIEEVKEEQ